MRVRDLQPASPDGLDLSVNVDLSDETGRVIPVEARRSGATGEATATVDGVADGVTATFSETEDRVYVRYPIALLGGAAQLRLAGAETRYDSGAVLSPLADEATGGCVVTIEAGYQPPEAEILDDLDVTILAIDTGLNGAHPEFDPSQVVAWWDFSSFPGGDGRAAGDPEPGDRTWFDTDGDGVLQGDLRDDVYDPDGHGSAVSSIAAGRNDLDPIKDPSSCPGCRLAFAKVYDQDADSLNGSVADAIRWGVDVVGVDVITISIGLVAPIPGFHLLSDEYEAARYAREQGVLVLFSNGNGFGNAGVPGEPGTVKGYGNSPDVLAVGADGTDSFLVTTDPEVVAIFTVDVAAAEGSGYRSISGTSFSAPFTAGTAARLIGEGRRCGAYDGPLTMAERDDLELLLKQTAGDRPEVPPNFEGHGVIDAASLFRAYEVLCLGAPRPALDPVNEAWTEGVAATLREAGTTDPDGLLGTTRTDVTGVTGTGEIGPSLPAGPKDAEIYVATVPAGATLDVAVTGAAPLAEANDLDLALFAGVSDAYAPSAELASSGNGGAALEELSWTNGTGRPQVVSLVVYGWAVTAPQAFTLTTSIPMALDFDGYLLSQDAI